jgi:hypothetical protein
MPSVDQTLDLLAIATVFTKLDALRPKTRPGARRPNRATVRQLKSACIATATVCLFI